MLKRTGEMSLGIIGVVVTFIVGLFVVIGTVGYQSSMEMIEQEMMQDPTLSAQEAEAGAWALELFSSVGWWIFCMHLIGLVIGIIAVIKLNSNAKLAGILFLVSGGAMLILTLGTSFIQSVLFIIAGIMCLVRKSPVPQKEEHTTETPL
ncbi:DUF4064 domain-containing protein [Salicibibacter kimchii]|uniref:DUF4064 domain-containing protein n=1 Tax=Salicibibacter kimchii TaxID=2099786 RepID=A0A345BZ31_9BACI|nr:DUF4064 domain-containing protein [Salicibibacter kimchii]AXF56212.1 DUF4064 domain-containing protein [Salicibibacter kimchii]